MNQNATEIIRKNQDLFTITNENIFGQDFVTKDGKISVKVCRKGGFTYGSTFYRLTIKNQDEIMDNLEGVYSKIIKVLKLT